MIRLTLVFTVWLASTAYAIGDARTSDDDEMHQAYIVTWSGADAEGRRLLDAAQHAWHAYRAAHCRLLGGECHALMAQERAAELRHLERLLAPDETLCEPPGSAGRAGLARKLP